MARIVYGVSGQGFGHSTRSKEVISHLTSQGHEVLVFTYGQALFFLAEFPVFEIPGLGLSYKNNKLVYWRTALTNVRQVARQSRQWQKLLGRFREFNPDLVITDFEPMSALLAKIQRLPLISLDNQHQLTNTDIEVTDKFKKDLAADKLIIKSIVWRAKYYLVTSFFATRPKIKNTFVFPALLRQEVLDLRPTVGDYFLVYQTSDFEYLLKVLKNRPEKFVIFGLNEDKSEGNLIFKNYSSHEWLEYLGQCRGIIATAGSSLISEALYLKKPYLAIPIKRQIEQIINAQYLQRQGYGLFTYKFTDSDFEEFIGNLDKYRENLAGYSHDGNQAIFKKLDEIIDYVS